MEEIIKSVMEALAASPQLALWALVVVYAYKVVVVGSVYGVIRFIFDRWHSAYTTPKHKLEVIDIEAKLRSMTIQSCHEDLIAQLERLRGIKSGTGGMYIHYTDVQWLRAAIDERIESTTRK